MSINYIPANPNNYEKGRRGVNIDTIIIHSIVGSANSAINTFKSTVRQVSAHYIVAWNGAVTQMVQDADTAYHAGVFPVNLRSIGIEHADEGQPNIVRPDILYEESAKLVASLCQKYNIPCDRTHILKHSEVKATACPAALDIDRIVNRARVLLNPSVEKTVPVGQITPGKPVNVRTSPKLLDEYIVGSMEQGQVFEVEGSVNGDTVLNNFVWYKVSNKNQYVWSGRVNITNVAVANTLAGDTATNVEEKIPVPGVWARAAEVLHNALPKLRTKDDQPFGNEEGLARELVEEWPKYLQLIIGEKKQRSLLDRIFNRN